MVEQVEGLALHGTSTFTLHRIGENAKAKDTRKRGDRTISAVNWPFLAGILVAPQVLK